MATPPRAVEFPRVSGADAHAPMDWMRARNQSIRRRMARASTEMRACCGRRVLASVDGDDDGGDARDVDALVEADARASSSESSEEDGEEDGKAMRKRYDEARGAIERALRGEGDSKNVAAKCRACPGTLLLNAGDMREHAKSKKHAKNLKRLGKADDDAFVCFYPAVKEDEGIVSDGEAETHAERLARLRSQKILRAAEGERTEGGKFSLDQFDSSDDEDGDGDSDDADDDARDAKMTKRLAKKEFLRKAKESAVSNDEGSKEKRSRRHAQRKRKGKSKPGKRQRMLMRAASNDA